MKTWSVILSGNLIGGFIFSGLLTALVGHIGTIDASSIVAIAEKVLATSEFPMFISAVFAGWLMGLVSWLVTSSRETISQIVIVIIITTVIGIAGLHHSIVGSIEVFTGLLLSADITLRDYLSFQTLAILGNVVGGVLFVAVMKMSQTHNVRSKRILSD